MIIKCDYCGKEFDKPAQQVNQSHKRGHRMYCSTKCRYKAGKIKCICARCGKEIWKIPAEVKRSKYGNVFCSRSCACSYNNSHFRKRENNPNWVNGHHYGSAYIRTAYIAYAHKCAVCGLDEECCLQVHHIDGNKHNDEIDNLIILCANCHSRVHRGNLIIDDNIKQSRK